MVLGNAPPRPQHVHSTRRRRLLGRLLHHECAKPTTPRRPDAPAGRPHSGSIRCGQSGSVAIPLPYRMASFAGMWDLRALAPGQFGGGLFPFSVDPDPVVMNE